MSLMKLRKILFLIFSLPALLHASSADRYTTALKLYEKASYKEAYPTIKEQAYKGNKEAQFLLAHLYEKGLGVLVNKEQALYWYKKSASKYTYITEKTSNMVDKNSSNLMGRIKEQMNYSSEEKGGHFAFSKIDTKTTEVKSRLLKMIENNFGLLPYQTNYLAPFSYSSTTHQRHFSAFNDASLPSEWQKHVNYDNHLEAEYQFSFQKPLTYNLFGWNEFISLAYTQHVWWKIYDDSSPFRETNYMPEVFMMLPTSDAIDEQYYLKGIKFGYRHQSNGQEGYQSRSWDRLFLTGLWQYDNLFIKAETWYRLPEEDKSSAFYAGTDPKSNGDDNPDILDYMGHGEVTGTYLWGEKQLSLMLRNNFKFHKNRGAIKINYTQPFINSSNTYWYLNLFSGYGESMIDYNQNIHKISLGFAYSRSLLN
ncbi:MAG: Phospholipase A1 precursor (EC; Outer membrane phospholipase A [uncultured Sulfurovum sp.]|uniref:Phosphatidylcholine 1-acylhydrolase n=1 Tax=uncultured Sulfurovum sp. TaxID=269237 RepID=A0A6S6SJX6_9BACT|nr:MAG: Phospholipase A1 precursor (EC; Outer membrane phospholipase A [uncultured Sulfurovum sp.]